MLYSLYCGSNQQAFYFLTYIQTFALTKRFRSDWSLLNLIVCVFCWVWRVLIGLVVEEQVLILLDSSEPKEAMSQDAVVTLFTLLLKAIGLCLLSWVLKPECSECCQKNHVCDLRGSLKPKAIMGYLIKQPNLFIFFPK